MSEQSTDDQRLQATEAQMRRALGLDRQVSPAPAHQSTIPITNGTHRGPRRFVRDGEVAVTVVHHDHQDRGTNRLDDARQALREQVAAREHAERQLQDANAAIESLQTQLAHERIANDEALSHAEDQRREVERQLEEERAARQQAEQERDAAIADRLEAQERLSQTMAAQKAKERSRAAVEGRAARKVDGDQIKASAASAMVEQKPRRRGRPPKVKEEPQTEFVEWWKPGWRERYR